MNDTFMIEGHEYLFTKMAVRQWEARKKGIAFQGKSKAELRRLVRAYHARTNLEKPPVKRGRKSNPKSTRQTALFWLRKGLTNGQVVDKIRAKEGVNCNFDVKKAGWYRALFCRKGLLDTRFSARARGK